MLSAYKRAIARASRATLSVCLCAILISCGGSSVSTPAPTAQFITPTQATTAGLGDSVSLAWTSSATTGCVASESSAAAGNFTSTQPVNGFATVTPTATGEFTYTISCTGTGGTAAATATVTVTVGPPKPIVQVAVPPKGMSLQLGGSTPITWLATNATSCTSEATGGFFSGPFDITLGVPPANTTSGTITLFPSGTGAFTYTITCTGPGGTTASSTSIAVAAAAGAPPITITAPTPGTSVVLGQAITVTWQSPTATFCFVIAGPGNEIGNNANSISIPTTTTGTVTFGVICSDSQGRESFAAAPPVTITPDFVGLAKISTVGPTADPVLHDLRPTGLTLATQTAGLVTAGDILTCNFNDSGKNAGHGTTLVGLNPTAGSTPYSIAQSTQLMGCNSLLTLPDGTLFAAAYTANQTPMISPAGVVSAALPVGTFVQPTGIAYAPGNTLYVAAIDLSRPDGGSIYRVTLNNDAPVAASVVRVLSGLCTSGSPGALFGPVALMYAQDSDMLYIADTSSGELIAISAVSTFSDAGQIEATCNVPPPTFLSKNENAPQEDNVFFIGFGFNSPVTPVGMTHLHNGNILVVNGDLLPPGPHSPPANSVIELSTQLSVIGPPRQLDTGAPGALSGIVATTDEQGNQLVYFTDANTNSVMLLKE